VFVLAAVLAATNSLSAQGVADVYASDASVKGSVHETPEGLEINNGAVITAGQHSASLRLSRGGQVRICPGTNLTVNSSPEGQQLMFAMSAGSLEADYRLPFTADVILTPDFRILISGPADVNLSVTATPNGDACVRARGDSSYVVVSELIGDDLYRVNPDEQVVFHAGHVKDPEVTTTAFCGCPPPAALERAETAAPFRPAPAVAAQTSSAAAQVAAQASAPASVPPQRTAMAQAPLNAPTGQAQPAVTPEQRSAAVAAIQTEPAVAATASAAAGLPAQATGPVQVQIDAPMVFKGTGSPPDVTATLARVHIEHLPWPETPSVSPQPPTPAKSKAQVEGAQKRGFFRRIIHALFG